MDDRETKSGSSTRAAETSAAGTATTSAGVPNTDATARATLPPRVQEATPTHTTNDVTRMTTK